MNAALTEIRFYGHLRPVFGKSLRLDVSSPLEAVRALCAVLPGFEAYIRKHSEPGYRVVVGRSPLETDQALHDPTGRQCIKFVPAVSGKAGLGKIIAGVALIGLSFVLPVTPLLSGFAFSASSIAMSLGISVALGGVSQMLAGTPQSPAPANPATNLPSYAFNGAVNTAAQGNAVPICYGRLRVGSQVISTGLEVASL